MEGGKILHVFQQCTIAHVGSGEEQRKVSSGSQVPREQDQPGHLGIGLTSSGSWARGSRAPLWCSHRCVWPAEHPCRHWLCLKALSVPGAMGRLRVGSSLQKPTPELCQAPRLRCWALCQVRGLMAAALYPQLETVETTLS